MANITKRTRKVKFKDLTPDEQKAEQIRKYESIWRFKKALCDEIQKTCGNDAHRWEIGEPKHFSTISKQEATAVSKSSMFFGEISNSKT